MNCASDAVRRFAILALVIGLVAQAAVVPAMAATSTTSPDEDCQERINTYRPYSPANPTGISECDAQEVAANATHGDIAASALALNDLQSAIEAPINNRLVDSRTIAKTIIKAETVRAMRNGSNLSVARTRINNSLDEYYAPMEENLVSSAQVVQVQFYYIEKARNQTGLNTDYVGFNLGDSRNSPTRRNASEWQFAYASMKNGTSAWDFWVANETLELSDGSNTTVQLLHATDGTDVQVLDPSNQTGLNGKYTKSFALSVYRPSAGPNVEDNNWNNSVAINAYDGYSFRDSWLKIQETNDEMQTKGAAYAESVYNTYNTSDFNGTEILDPITLTREFNTDYESTGYYGWLAAEMGTSGLEGNINSSFTIEYTPRVNHTPTNFTLNGSGTEYAFVNGTATNVSGTLMTDWAPASTNGTFQKGATYDTANTNGSVIFIEQVNANTSRVVNLNGTFTVTGLTNVQTGESVNETSLEEQNYQTFEPNSTIQELKNILQWRSNATDVNTAGSGSGGGGGGFNFGFNLGTAGIGAIAVLLGGAYLASSGASKAS